MPNPQKRWIIVVAFVSGIIVGLICSFAFQSHDRWHFEQVSVADGLKMLVRIDRSSGTTEMFYPTGGGWGPVIKQPKK